MMISKDSSGKVEVDKRIMQGKRIGGALKYKKLQVQQIRKDKKNEKKY